MPPSSNSASRRRLGLGLFVALQGFTHLAAATVGFDAISKDEIGMPTLSQTIFAVTVLGICVGQTTLAAIWLALRTTGIFQRAPLVLLSWANSLLLLIVIFGASELFVAVGCLLLGQLVLLQVPLVVLRCLRWQLGTCEESQDSERRSQFSLRHLFYWMAGCACLVGISRIVYIASGKNNNVFDFESLLVICLVAAYPLLGNALLAFLAAPAVAARRFWGVWIVVVGLLLPSYSYFESLHTYFQVSEYRISDFTFLLWFNAAHVAWLMANLLFLRLAGYRLTRAAIPTV